MAVWSLEHRVAEYLKTVERNQWIPCKPHPKQRVFLLLADIQEVLFGGAARGGKQLDLLTEVPTPSGWKRVGELEVGDRLFGELGQTVTITNVHPINLSPVSYRMKFDDGSFVDCCEEHLWLTYSSKELAALTRRNPEWIARRRASRRSRSAVGAGTKTQFTLEHRQFLSESITKLNREKKKNYLPQPSGTVRSTKEIVESMNYGSRGGRNHAVPVAKAIELPESDFPLDPYVLGAWLGDGSKGSGGLTGIDPEIWQEVEKAGFSVTHSKKVGKAHYIRGLVPVLRRMGILHEKRVPGEYLRGSITQRLALLQGLMDTDGHVNIRGQCEFDNTNRNLAEAVAEIACSLGNKAVVTEGRATLYGKDCGPKYRVKWMSDLCPFRLPRKVKRWRPPSKRVTKFRYIVSCERIDSIPMRCITVDNPTGLFLVSRSFIPTHNTVASLMAAAQYIDVPGYACLILRKNYADLYQSGGFIPLSKEWWLGKGADWNEQQKTWAFPSGATIKFGHLDRDDDVYQYQGGQYQCVAKGTPVRMGDGSLKLIEKVKPGDMVWTLEGPKRVKRAFGSSRKECVRATVKDSAGRTLGSQVHPADHPVLTPDGWMSYNQVLSASAPDADKPRRSRGPRTPSSQTGTRCQSGRRTFDSRSQGRRRLLALAGSLPDRSGYSAFSVSRAGSRTGSAGSCGGHRGASPPRPLSVPVVLCEPVLRSDRTCCPHQLRGESPRVLGETEVVAGSPAGCRDGCDSCGERFPSIPSIARPHLRQRVGAEAHTQSCSHAGGPGCTPSHSRSSLTEYVHPYTRAVCPVSAVASIGSCSMSPVGEQKVYDIEVDGANHYVTETGLTNQNCIIVDELVQHTQWRYRYLFSRLTPVTSGPLQHVPLRMRSTANPGGTYAEWVKKRFIDPKTKDPRAVFVPSRVEDNPSVDRDRYVESLDYMDPITRAQLLEGDWDAYEGGRFKKEWFRYYRRDKDQVVIKATDGGNDEVFSPWTRPRWQTCDPAASTSTAADHFVLSDWCLSPRANLVWLGCHRAKYEIPEQVAVCQRRYRQMKPQFLAVEEVLNQRALAQLLRRSVDPPMVIKSVSPKGKDKLSRAAGAINLCASGRLYLPEDDRSFPLEDVEGELIRFTGEAGGSDDAADSLFYSVECLTSVSAYAGPPGSKVIPTYYDPVAPITPQQVMQRRAKMGPTIHKPR